MSEMVERVARTIFPKISKWTYSTTKRLSLNEVCVLAARAAIEAMREPTEDMKREVLNSRESPYVGDEWRKMIDAALKESS